MSSVLLIKKLKFFYFLTHFLMSQMSLPPKNIIKKDPYQSRYNSIRNSRFQEYFTINVNPDTSLSVWMRVPSSYGWWGIRVIHCSIMVPTWAYTSIFYRTHVTKIQLNCTLVSMSIMYTTLFVTILVPSCYGWRGIRSIQCSNRVVIWAYTSVFYSISVLRYNSTIL